MKFQIGDRVRVLDADQKGKILKQIDHQSYLVEIDEFDYPILAKNLVPDSNFLIKQQTKIVEAKVEIKKEIQPIKEVEIPVKSIQFDQKPTPEIDSKTYPWNIHKTKQKRWIEVDLHFYELRSSQRYLSPHQILNIQLSTFDNCIQFAVNQRITDITVIHGLGKGKLKRSIENKLESDFEFISMENAALSEYGYGASQLVLHFSSSAFKQFLAYRD
ncbi:MAG: Smr/MutS family protein [Flavobacteriales bacterium]